jgi:hypothetical protein
VLHAVDCHSQTWRRRFAALGGVLARWIRVASAEVSAEASSSGGGVIQGEPCASLEFNPTTGGFRKVGTPCRDADPAPIQLIWET